MKPVLPDGLVATFEHHHVEDEVYAGHEGPVEQVDLVPEKAVPPVMTPLVGYTFARVYRADDGARTKTPLAVGLAMCGEQDIFDFEIGRDISLGRALKILKDKEQHEEPR